jgi:hypothetical protein
MMLLLLPLRFCGRESASGLAPCSLASLATLRSPRRGRQLTLIVMTVVAWHTHA